MHRVTLLETIKGLNVVKRNYDPLIEHMKNPPATIDHITHTRNLVHDINKKLAEILSGLP